MREAIRKLIAKATNGDVDAQVSLAVSYATGEGLPLDLELAFHWYQCAARLGDANAAYHVGSMLLSGEGCRRSSVSGKRYLREAAEGGSSDAAMALGYLALDGNDPSKRLRAVRWFARAVSDGDARGLRSIAFLLQDGAEGVRVAALALQELKAVGVNIERKTKSKRKS